MMRRSVATTPSRRRALAGVRLRALCLCALLLPALVDADPVVSPAPARTSTLASARGADARPVIADVAVRDQADRPLHFYRDLVQGHLVVVNFIFTDCGTVCPLMGLRYAQLQTALGAQAREVQLISVSIDPRHDTPARLAEWSAKFGAKPGWTLVTGDKTGIDTLLTSLGVSAVDPAAHAPLQIVIDDASGDAWQRLDGLAEPATVANILRQHLSGTGRRQ